MTVCKVLAQRTVPELEIGRAHTSPRWFGQQVVGAEKAQQQEVDKNAYDLEMHPRLMAEAIEQLQRALART
jgi:hypothetical protein